MFDDLRKFCIPPNYEEKLWQEFNEIRQTMHGRSKLIKQVATELLTMKMRIPKLTTTQMYYQFKTAMDPNLEALISPYIHPDMAWNEIVDMAVRYDTALKNKNKQKSTTNYSKKPSFQKNFNKNNNWNNKPKNFNKPFNKTFNKSNNNNRSFSNNNKSKNINNKPKRDLATVTCYNCNEKGHYANKCPKKSIKSAAQTVQPRRTNPYPKKPFIKSAAIEVRYEQEHLPPELYDKNSKHIVIDVLINGNPARALVDQQTTRANLISTSYATTYNLPLVQFEEDLAIRLSRQGSRGKSTYYVKTKLTIGQHEEMASFCVAALSDWDLILAEPFLRKLKAIINIADHSMTIKPCSDSKPTTIKATSNRQRMTPLPSSIEISSASIMVSVDYIDDTTKDNKQALDQWISKVMQKIEDPVDPDFARHKDKKYNKSKLQNNMTLEVDTPPKKRQKLDTAIQPPPELLEVTPLTLNGKLPQRSTSGAAGYDLDSAEDKDIPPQTRELISTDIAITVPKGTYGRIAPRSGLAVKSIDIGAGVIDKGYTGNIKAFLINNSKDNLQVKKEDRIAQLILETIKTPHTILKNNLEPTNRGSKGFGSTGISSCLTTVQTATNPPQITSYSYDDVIKKLGYDPIKEFTEVFPSEKPTELLPLRHINHSIDIIDKIVHQNMRPRRIRPTEKILLQLREKIDQELASGRIYPTQDSSACSMFMI